MAPNGEKLLAAQNVLSTEEACDILGRSRQQLHNYINSGDISIFKALSNGNLFWKPDVYELLQKINRKKSRNINPILGFTTWDSLEAFKKINVRESDIDEIHVFLSEKDAIMKNFYNVVEVEMPNSLARIESARLIIIMKSGEEYWFDGFTCGYCGTGCRGTNTVLTELGIIEKSERISHIVSDNQVLRFYRNEEGKWTYDGEPSSFDKHTKNILSKKTVLEIDEQFYRYNGRLVLTQNFNRRGLSKEMSKEEKIIIARVLFFVPNPVSIVLLTEDEAIQTGHFQVAYGRTKAYQIIIRDFSDRELWIYYPFDELLVEKQYSIKELLCSMGFVFSEETMCERILNWLRIKPRTIYGHYELQSD